MDACICACMCMLCVSRRMFDAGAGMWRPASSELRALGRALTDSSSLGSSRSGSHFAYLLRGAREMTVWSEHSVPSLVTGLL
ncbi:hypothetical protein CALCODRAFT_277681 [Calocera cornea HHB12733]|uniref:Uncharacterized protein n=1 Tax=Calocera cornea HHB12733 TaxID=1353952 RepID=A0A165JPM7_9BASI|nr:hypothetical protein CALCODRAFT_277681 [Calocera cornea HHB12733]